MKGVLRYELNSNFELNYAKFNIIYLAIPEVVNAVTKVFEKYCENKDSLYTTSDG